jgi:hypothetical protein
MTISKRTRQMVSSVDSRRIRNNTQRVLLALLRAEGDWVPRTSVRVRNATSRMRELRRSEYGGFDVQVATASELGRPGGSRRTYYRINPRTITADRVAVVMRDAVTV